MALTQIHIDDDATARAAGFVVPRAQKPRRVLVAMSGGVDSAVAAWLLREAGHEVTAVSLRLAPETSTPAQEGRCCSVDDMTDARRVCDALDIPFYAIDARERFRAAVVEPFVQAYRQGLTPIPCLACNHDVKLGDLLERARDLGAALATGHYVRKVAHADGWALARPYDADRDQSYWLYGTPHADLDALEFPLGDLDKPLVRALALRAGLPVAKKADSQEICFVPDGDHARVVERIGGAGVGGDLVHIGGRVLGAHKGVHHYTVGQRRGTAAVSGTGEKLYVVDVDGANNRVVMGPKDALACTTVRAAPLRLAQPLSTWPARISCQVRARHRAQSATWHVRDDGALEIVFDEPVLGVALGQACVAYDGDRLLGGGLLTERVDGAAPRAQALASLSTL